MSRTYLGVLETMWDWRGYTSKAGYGEAPAFFHINPENFSGRRLYKLTGMPNDRARLWCTNVCGELGDGPHFHGVPSLQRLETNLARWYELLRERYAGSLCTILVCGKVAQVCFEQIPVRLWPLRPWGRAVYLPHPAARNWTKQALARAARFIQEGTADLRMKIGSDGRLEVRKI